MANYETIFIVRQDVPAAQVKALAENYKTLLKSQGGEISKVEYCGLRTLAYRIRKNRKGHYVLMNVTAEPPALGEMERQLKLNEDILRFLTIGSDSLDSQPSVLMQTRSIRERPANQMDEDIPGLENADMVLTTL